MKRSKQTHEEYLWKPFWPLWWATCSACKREFRWERGIEVAVVNPPTKFGAHMMGLYYRYFCNDCIDCNADSDEINNQIHEIVNRKIMCVAPCDDVANNPDDIMVLQARVERLTATLKDIAEWRKGCWFYDEDMDHARRDFIDGEEWDLVEKYARAALNEEEDNDTNS